MDKKVYHDILKKNKAEGAKILLYVYLYKDQSSSNPLKNLPYYAREKEARYRAFDSYDYVIDEKWDVLLQEALSGYPITDEQRDIYTYDKKMDQLDLLLKETAPKIKRNERKGDGSIHFSTNIGIINSILKDITNIIQAKASLVAMHTLGTIPKHLRGGLSPLTKGKIKTL